ncbi:MAG: PAS domain S-box protein [Planctomycetota bacterium]
MRQNNALLIDDDQPNQQIVSLFRLFAQVISIIIALSGIIVLIGWLFDIPALKSVHPSLVAMKSNTALNFVLIGAFLLILQMKVRIRWLYYLAQISAVVVALVGLLTLSEYILGWNLGIDQLMFKEAMGAVATSSPGRMAPNTALNFLLIGLALLLLDVETKRGYRPAQFLILIEGVISLLALLGYVYGYSAFYGLPNVTKMAVHTAVLFNLIFIGVLLVRPDRGYMRVITSESAGGILARWLLPISIIIPIILGGFLAWCEHQGFYAVGLKNLFYITITIPLFSLLIFLISKSFHQMSIARKQAENKLKQIAYIVESSDDAIVGKTLDGIITSWNKGAKDIYGYTAEEIIGHPVSMLIPSDQPNEISQIIEKIKNGQKVENYETLRMRKDGRRIYVSLTVSLVKDTKGNIIGFSSVARDVTKVKEIGDRLNELNQELEYRINQVESANKELEAFSYSVSHDLRTPLRAIDGFSQIIMEEYRHKLDDEGKRLLNVVRNNTTKMGELIDDLLAFSRISRMGITKADINMEKLTEVVIDELKPATVGRDIQISVIKPLPVIYGDRTTIKQVWINLISNAIKFTQPQKTALIEISGKQEQGENIYYVKDNGVGFDMQYVNKLFGVFQRLHSNEEFEGTGIGLALSQRIIHKHGGEIRAEGKVNEGATFYFTIPRETREDGR